MSKPVVVTIPHQLGRAEARRRIDEGIGRLVHQFAAMGQMSHAWEGDMLRFSVAAVGQAVTGAVQVRDHEVILDVVLPGLLAMIADKVRGRIQKEGQVLLEDRSKR